MVDPMTEPEQDTWDAAAGTRNESQNLSESGLCIDELFGRTGEELDFGLHSPYRHNNLSYIRNRYTCCLAK